jgi:hypothetical protein
MHTRLSLTLPGLLLISAGVAIMLAAVLTGNAIQPDVARLGMDGYMAVHGWGGFMLFAFGFPLGLAVAATGLFTASGGKACSLLPFAVLLLLAALLPMLAPMLLGREPDAAFFGTAGYLLMFLILASFWFWAVYRAGLAERERTAADLQGAGYACFAMVAWNICGVGGMPGYALDQPAALANGSHAFAIGQMKAVMLLLLTGWLLTLLGLQQAARLRRDRFPEDA